MSIYLEELGVLQSVFYGARYVLNSRGTSLAFSTLNGDHGDVNKLFRVYFFFYK